MAEKTLNLRIITPDHTLVEQAVRSVRFTGLDGEYGILANHAPLMTATQPGPLRYVREDGNHEHVVLTDGFAEMLGNTLTIICEAGEHAAEIDLERARKAEQRARERLAQRGATSIDTIRAEAALRRALARQHGVRRATGRVDF